MGLCVLDASGTFQWLFRDEASADGYAALGAITASGAAVPAPWFAEITNGLGLAERRGRLDPAGVRDALQLLHSLPLTLDGPATLARFQAILGLMRAHRPTAHDGTCLDLARRLGGGPLATEDRDLRRAASAMGVALFSVTA